MEARPWLAREEDKSSNTPMHLAVRWHKSDVLSVLLEHDRSLGYQVSTLGNPLLVSAAYRGHVDVARELLKHCPDAPCYNTRGSTCLHIAVQSQQTEFVKFVLGLPQLQKHVNMRDENGDTALHVAVQKCDPKMVAALLLHRDIDITVVNNNGCPVNRTLPTDRAKTLNWVRVFSLTLVHKSVYACRSFAMPCSPTTHMHFWNSACPLHQSYLAILVEFPTCCYAESNFILHWKKEVFFFKDLVTQL